VRIFGFLSILSVLSVGLFASGCKESASSAEAAAAVPAVRDVPLKAVIDPRPVLECFGDSLTAGYGTDAGESYPDDLQRRLDAEGYKYHVVNAGISGDTTKDGLDRIGRVLARHPQVVVLEFGANDGLRGFPLEDTQANLATMIEKLQAGGSQVALAGITLTPDYGPDYIARFNAMYPALAKRYHLRLLPFLLQGVYGVRGEMQEDGHHATAQGNQQVAVNVEGLVKPLLKR
jgi:acyl-CoA thioesterase-1